MAAGKVIHFKRNNQVMEDRWLSFFAALFRFFHQGKGIAFLISLPSRPHKNARVSQSRGKTIERVSWVGLGIHTISRGKGSLSIPQSRL